MGQRAQTWLKPAHLTFLWEPHERHQAFLQATDACHWYAVPAAFFFCRGFKGHRYVHYGNRSSFCAYFDGKEQTQRILFIMPCDVHIVSVDPWPVQHRAKSLRLSLAGTACSSPGFVSQLKTCVIFRNHMLFLRISSPLAAVCATFLNYAAKRKTRFGYV